MVDRLPSRNSTRKIHSQIHNRKQWLPPHLLPKTAHHIVPSLNANDEESMNEFSQFYTSNATANIDDAKTLVELELFKYRHKDALLFASQTWKEMLPPVLPAVRKSELLQTFCQESNEIRAYYRVVAENNDNYKLLACHVNVHGFHRPDLRFIEVNNRTVTRGAETFSVMGKLFLGDIVAVTELVQLRKPRNLPFFKVDQDTPCRYMASAMTVLKRSIALEQSFSLLENGKAVVSGYTSVMNAVLNRRFRLQPDVIYSGSLFLPQKIKYNFTRDFDESTEHAVSDKAARCPSYRDSSGTVFAYKNSAVKNKLYQIGTKVYELSESLSEEQMEDAVEICTLMGLSAALSIQSGRSDSRTFPVRDVQIDNLIVRFSIINPAKNPTAGLWNSGNRIVFKQKGNKYEAIIETVTLDPGKLKIVARLARGERGKPRTMSLKGSIIVSQSEFERDTKTLSPGFFAEMYTHSNGKRIIKALYGGKSIPLTGSEEKGKQYSFLEKQLNKYQNDYVTMLLDRNPLTVACAPFGCGKSMTIVSAAFEAYQQMYGKHFLLTQSNYASVNLANLALKMDNNKDIFLRYVTERNWLKLADNCQTELDMPLLLQKVMVRWARGEFDNTTKAKKMSYEQNRLNAQFVLQRQLLSWPEFSHKIQQLFRFLPPRLPNRRISADRLVHVFLSLYDPKIIISTADTMQGMIDMIKSELYWNVSTVQIDEASQLPECTFITLLKSFPDACYGLIGDIHQLPPYCDDDMQGKLKEYGIGETMKRAVEKNMFPQALLRYVYRCHPQTTKLLGKLFYDGQLLTGVSATDHMKFMLRRRDIWPDMHFPIMVLNNTSPSKRMGTSAVNRGEASIVMSIVNNITNHSKFPIDESDVGVISFYKAQTNELMESLRGTKVKCGTVDAFQGSEREVVIVCCTNETLSEFMQLSNRVNVALSRARQATIIIGNVSGMKKAKYWESIVEAVENNRCLVQNINHPFYTGDDGTASLDSAMKRLQV